MIAVRLYRDEGWSAVQIAMTVGIGRRAVESALKREGIILTRRSVRGAAIDPAYANAVRVWFADAERPEREPVIDPAPPQAPDGTFRRRRCQQCWQLNAYCTFCVRCGAKLDGIDEEPDDVVKLRVEQSQRGRAT